MEETLVCVAIGHLKRNVSVIKPPLRLIILITNSGKKAHGKASKGKRHAASHTTEPMALPARPARQVSPPHRPLARTDIRGSDAQHSGVSARQYTPKSTAGRSNIISQAHNSPRPHQQAQGHQHGVNHDNHLNRHNSHRSVPLPKPVLQSRSNCG